MGKRTVTLKTTLLGSVVHFATESGEGLKCDTTALSPAMRERAMLAGVAHTIRDAGALPMGSTMAEKIAAMRERWECIVGGEWERERAAMSPEDRAAKLRAEVREAWMSLLPGRTAEEFDKMVERNRASNSAALQMPFTAGEIIAGLAKTAKIAGAMAAAKKPAVALEFDEV